MQYNKLVRDNIPAHLDSKGIQHTSHIADESEYWTKLQEKFSEEMNEALSEMKSGNNEKIIEELADVLEVINAIAKHQNITLEDIEKTRRIKKEERGGFENRIILDETL